MTNIDRRRALMAVKKGGGRLPAEYQQVEYINSVDDTPYISTGLALEKRYPITIATEFLMTSTGVYNGFVVTNNPGTNPTLAINAKGGLGLRVGSQTYTATSENASNRIIKATVTINSDGCICDFEDAGAHYLAQTNSVPGSMPNLSVYYTPGHGIMRGRVYYVTVTQQGATVLKLVPCYCKSDGVIGMYDLISRTFFVNAGSGVFRKGSDV